MGGDGSPRLVCSGAEACKYLKLIGKPHMRPVCFYDQKPLLQSGWWVLCTSLGAGGTITTSSVPCTTAIQGAHNANTCSPTSQVRSTLGFIGGEWFNLECLFIEMLRARTEYREEHPTSFSGTKIWAIAYLLSRVTLEVPPWIWIRQAAASCWNTSWGSAEQTQVILLGSMQRQNHLTVLRAIFYGTMLQAPQKSVLS